MDYLTVNLVIISKKWPHIYQQLDATNYNTAQVELIEDHQLSLVFDTIQVASSYDQEAEAKIQIKKLPTDAPKVTIYGTGVGVVQKELLKAKDLQVLEVIILNLPLFKACLTYFDQQDWLLDERVTLKSSVEVISVSRPYIALPAELVLATNESASLRDRICLTLDDEFIRQNKGTGNSQLQDNIVRNLPFIKKDYNVEALFSKKLFPNSNSTTDVIKKDFIICGAGPTLEDHFTWLKKRSTRDKFTIVAVDAAVFPLAQAGIIVDIVVSIDPLAKKLLDCLNLEHFKNVPLVYFPVVSAELLSLWKGPRYTAYSTGDLYDEINKTIPKGRLYCAGSVIHPAIDLSVRMAATTILLLGADFSFPGKKSHTHWQENNSNTSIHLNAEETTHWVLNSFNERVPTLLNYRGYLRDLEDYITLAKHVKFYNGSKNGAYISGTELWSEDDFLPNKTYQNRDV